MGKTLVQVDSFRRSAFRSVVCASSRSGRQITNRPLSSWYPIVPSTLDFWIKGRARRRRRLEANDTPNRSARSCATAVPSQPDEFADPPRRNLSRIYAEISALLSKSNSFALVSQNEGTKS